MKHPDLLTFDRKGTVFGQKETTRKGYFLCSEKHETPLFIAFCRVSTQKRYREKRGKKGET